MLFADMKEANTPILIAGLPMIYYFLFCEYLLLFCVGRTQFVKILPPFKLQSPWFSDTNFKCKRRVGALIRCPIHTNVQKIFLTIW